MRRFGRKLLMTKWPPQCCSSEVWISVFSVLVESRLEEHQVTHGSDIPLELRCLASAQYTLRLAGRRPHNSSQGCIYESNGPTLTTLVRSKDARAPKV